MKMCMTWLLNLRAEGMVVELQAAKPVTTFQDCMSTFVSQTPLDILELGQFLATFFIVDKIWIFLNRNVLK